MEEIKIFNQEDMILHIDKNYNPFELQLDKWELFLDVLCGLREYQKEAIKNAIIYMCSKKYDNLYKRYYKSEPFRVKTVMNI